MESKDSFTTTILTLLTEGVALVVTLALLPFAALSRGVAQGVDLARGNPYVRIVEAARRDQRKVGREVAAAFDDQLAILERLDAEFCSGEYLCEADVRRAWDLMQAAKQAIADQATTAIQELLGKEG
jgi:hypothetical protein